MFNHVDYYVVVSTKEEYDETMWLLHEKGYRWASGNLLPHLNYWHLYEADGCSICICDNKKEITNCFPRDIGISNQHRCCTLSEYKVIIGEISETEDDIIGDVSAVL